MRWVFVLSGLLFLAFFVVFPSFSVEAAIYWHFTIQAQGDDGEEEWLWVTLREVPKKTYHAQIHQKVLSLGGKGLSGARLIQVRAKAWRKAYRTEESFPCDTYLPKFGKRIKYWQESWSNWVFCQGQIIPPSAEEKALHFSPYFELSPMRAHDVQKILNRERRFLTITELPGEEVKGRFNIYAIEYLDPLMHYEDTCRSKKWAKHYRPILLRLDLHSGYREIGLGFATVEVFDHLILTYSLYRSHSPEHRFFGKRVANFGSIQEFYISQELAFEETLLGEEETESGNETIGFPEENAETEMDEEIIAFTEEETSEEVMTFTPEEIDLAEEEGVEVIRREGETPEDVMVFTEEDTR